MPSDEGIDRTISLPAIPKWEGPKEAEPFFRQLSEFFRLQHYALAAAYDELAKRINELPVMVGYGFYQENVAANQTDVALSDGLAGRGYLAPEDGSVVCVVVRTNDARTAGTLTITPVLNGSAASITATLDGSAATLSAENRQRQGIDTFSRGHRISAQITTDSSWAPTTADIDVIVGVVFSKGIG